MLRKILAYRNLLFVLILLSSSCLFLTDDKRAGIAFLRELYIFLLVAATGCLLVVWKRLYQSKTSLWILFIGVAVPVSSAVLAYLNFGQPIIYGLLEERRSLQYLVFFPTLFLLLIAKPAQEDIEKYFLYVALVCATIGFLYYFGIIPANQAFDFEVDYREGIVDPIRADRYRIGGPIVGAVAFMLMYSMKEKVSLAKLGLLLYLAAYLWLVMQTRQTMLTWALGGLWIFRKRIDSLLKVALLGLSILVTSYLITPEFYHEQFEKFHALLFEATSEPGVRDDTIRIVINAVRENSYFGRGALSLQWNGGFSRIYNRHFYLSDVGIFGVYYRFGFLTPFVALIYYVGFFRIMRKCPDKGNLLSSLKLIFVMSTINIVLSNSLTSAGQLWGMAAAFFLYFSTVQAKDSSTAKSGRINYGQFQYRNYKLE